MKKIERKMTKNERDELEGFIAISTSCFRYGISLVLATIIFSIAYKINIWISPSLYWWWIPSLILVLFIFFKLEKFSGGMTFRRQVRKDLEKEKVLEETFCVNRIIKFPEGEDEGDAYLFEDDQKSVFILLGQESNSLRKKFPFATIKVVKTIFSNHQLSISASGICEEKFISSKPLNDYSFDDLVFNSKSFAKIDYDFDAILKNLTTGQP